jgi:hypothetical protein
LNNSIDKPLWKCIGSKQFTVNSVYGCLTKNENGPAYKSIWKSKIPEKVKIFMWMTAQKAILTKHNIIKRNYRGSKRAYEQRIDHFGSILQRSKWVSHW